MEKGCLSVDTLDTLDTVATTNDPNIFSQTDHFSEMYDTYDNNTADTNATYSNDTTNTTNGIYSNDTTTSTVSTSKFIFNGDLKCSETAVKEHNLGASELQVRFSPIFWKPVRIFLQLKNSEHFWLCSLKERIWDEKVKLGNVESWLFWFHYFD